MISNNQTGFSRKLVVFLLSILFLFSPARVFSQTVNLPAALSCTWGMTGTGSCVSGYFASGWTSGGNWQYSLNTAGYSNIVMSFHSSSSGTGPTTGQIYYNTGGADTYTGFSYAATACGVKGPFSLPAGCNNDPVLNVKMFMSGATSSGGTNRVDGNTSSTTSPLVFTGQCSTPNSYTVSTAGASVCTGAVVQLSGSDSWCAYDLKLGGATVQTISGTGGVVSFSSASTTTVGTYTVVARNVASGCTTSATMSGSAILGAGPSSPAAITGMNTVCAGGPDTLSDVTSGGVWSSSNTSVATVGSSTGIVTGVVPGTVTITYTISNSCGSNSTTMIVTVNAAPSSITGTTNVCVGSTTTLTGSGGGAWTSSNTSLAVVGSGTGVVTGVAAGFPVITYTIPSGCYSTAIVTVNATSSGVISGSSNICTGLPSAFTETNPGGVWSSTNTSVATAGSASGIVTGVALGTATISYTINNSCGSYATGYPVTVNVSPSAPVLTPTVVNMCPGDPAQLISATGTTVTWSPSTGLYTNSGGTVPYTGTATNTIYTLPVVATTVYSVTSTSGFCYAVSTITVNLNTSITAGTISGSGNVCIGSTTPLTDATTGGTWSSSNTAVATVGTTGVVTGVSGGTATISYTVTSGSCTLSATKTITVNTIPVLSAISGTTVLCLSGAATSTLTNTTSGGTWTSSNTAVATIGSSSGVATAVSTGTAVITYNVINGACSSSVTTNVTVGTAPGPLSMSPLFASLCPASSPQMLTASGGMLAASTSVSSGSISVSVAAVHAVGTSSLTVSGIPSGAVVTGITATVNFSSNFLNDYVLNLLAPNGNVLNLINMEGPHGSGSYTNTVISSTGTSLLALGSSPFTGTYAADTLNGVGVTPYVSNVTSWSALTSILNGTWTLSAYNNSSFTNSPTNLTGFTLNINYNYPVTPTWSPVAGLYTNSGGTTAYTSGAALSTVYALPASSTAFTATSTNGSCTSTATVPVNVSPTLYVPVINGQANACIGLTDTLTDSLPGGTWTSSNTSLATVGSANGVVTGVAAGTVNITYSVTIGACAGYGVKTITVNALPSLASISGPGTVCSGSTITLSDATGGGTWSSSAPAVATIGTGGLVTPVAPGSTVISYSITNGVCPNVAMVTVNSLITPGVSTVTPASTTICPTGPATLLTAGGGLISGSATFSTTATQVCNPSLIGVSPITVSGIPAGAVVTGVSLTFSATQAGGAWDNDDIFNIQGPNGHILNLITLKGGSGSSLGFTNTTLSSSLGTTGFPSTGQPFTGTYAADATLGAGGGAYASDSSTWSCLYSTGSINGTWNFIGTYSYSSGTTVINNWSLTINYQMPTTYTWGPLTGLYTNSGGTTSYTGTNTGTIYALPSTSTTYTLTAANGACSANATAFVSVNPLPAAITGTATVCPGTTTTLSDASPGGSWTSSNPAIAAIGTSAGAVNGVAAGNATITYTLPTGCYITRVVTVNPLPSSISGSLNVCPGTSATLTDAGGGSWTSGTTSVATIGSGSGILTGVTVGTSVVTYTISTGCYVTAIATVNPFPSAISGTMNVCVAGTTTLSDAGGGTWTSSNTSLATVGSTTGVVTGVSAGNPTITYTATTGCITSSVITVNPLPASISGTPVVCIGSTTTLTDAGGGTWSSSSTSLATVGSATGVVSGVASGTPLISYFLPTGCYSSVPVTVNSLPPVHNVTGGGSYCTGGTGVHIGLNGSDLGVNYQLYNGSTLITAAAGTGSPVDFGFVTGAGVYSVTAVYATTGCSVAQAGSATITVNPLPNTFGLTGGGAYCAGSAGAIIGLAGSNTGISYQLYVGGISTGLPVTGTGSAISFGPQTTAGAYTAIATNLATTCSRSMTGGATVSINAAPAAYTLSGGGAYCSGGAGLHIILNNSNVGVNYQLYNGTTLVGAPFAGTGTSIDFGLQTGLGTYTVVGVNAATGCSNTMTGSITISLSPLPNSYSVTGGGGYCPGASGVLVGLSYSDPGVNYQLMVGSTTVGAPVAGTGSAISFGSQTIAGTYTVVATNVTTGCSANMSGSVVVSVYPVPTLNSVVGGGSYCAGGVGVHVGLNGSVTGIAYQLYCNGVAVGSPVAGTGIALDFGLQTLVGVYTVIGTNATTGCASNMIGSVAVTVNSLPGAFSVTGGGMYCAGGAGVHVGLSGSVWGISYYLYDGLTLVGGGSGTGAAIDFGLELAPGIYTVTAVDPVTGCNNNMTGIATITVNALPAIYSVTGGGSYCAGGAGVIVGLSNSDVGVSYQLYNAGVVSGVPVIGTGSPVTFGLQTVTGPYTVIANNTATSCANYMSGVANVLTNPLPAVYAVTGGGAYCAGGAGVVVGLAASSTGTTYQLYNGGSSVGAPIAGTGSAISFGPMTASGTYTVRATNPSTTCSSAMAGAATIVVNTLPLTFSVTSTGSSYCAGGTGVLVGLSGSETGANYQLFRGTTPVGGTVAGTGSSISFGSVSIAGAYTVLATNATTACTNNMTGSAVISISGLPAAYTVAGGGTYCSGGSGAHVTLSGSATGVNYQLYLGGVAAGSAVAGTGSLLDFGPQTAAGLYTVVATNASTSCSNGMAGSATVAINALPALNTVTGGGNYCPGGAGVHVGLNSSVTGVSYQLFAGGAGIGAPLAGTGSALDFGLQTYTGIYSVVATNTVTGCSQTMTGTPAIALYPAPVVHGVIGGGSYCAGGAGVHVGLDGSDIGVNYQLFDGSAGSGSPVAGTSLPLDFGLKTASGVYSVVATSVSNGCTATMSGAVSVGVTPLPNIFNVTGGGSFCAGSAGVHVGLSGSNPGITYLLYLSGVPTGSHIGGTGAAIDFGLQTLPGSYIVAALNNTTGCISNMNGIATVVVNPLPSIHNVTGGGVYCAGSGGVHIGLNGSDAGISYQSYTGGAPSGIPTAGSGSALDLGLRTAAGVYSVTAMNTVTGCTSSMIGTVAVSVNAVPSVYNVLGGGYYCAGGSGVNVVLSSSDTGINYQLFNGAASIGGPVPGIGSTLNFGLQTGAGHYSVTAINAATGCSSNMAGTATIGISSLPVAVSVTGGGGYCSGGGGVHVGLAGSAVGINYRLYLAGVPIGPVYHGIGAALDFGLQTAGGVYTAVATDPGTTCSNTMSGSASVIVEPLPNAYAVTGSSPAYCAGGTGVNIAIAASDPGIHYQLYLGTLAVGGYLPGTGASISFGPQLIAGIYRVVATNVATGCTQLMTGTPSVVANPAPAIYAVTGGGAYCIGGTGVHVGLSGSAYGMSYQLYNGGVASGSPVTGTGSTLDFGLRTATGAYTVVAANASTGCTGTMAGSAVISTSGVPTVYTVTGGGNYCPGGPGVNIGLNGSSAGIQYQLYMGSTPVSTPVSGTGLPLNFGMQPATGTYTIVGSNLLTGCSSVMTGTATVGLYTAPPAHLVTNGGSYCLGDPGIHVGLVGSDTGNRYQLYHGSTAVGTPLVGTGVNIDFGAQPLAGTYTVVATNSTTGCMGTMTGSASISINPLPAAFAVTGGGSYCAGTPGVHVGLANSQAGVNYTLYTSGTVLASLPGSGGALDFGLRSDTGIYLVRGTIGATGCFTTMTGSARVNVNPSVFPLVSISTGQGDTVCAGSLTTFTAVPVNGGLAPSYQWAVNGVVAGAGSTYNYIPLDGDVVRVIMTSSATCAVPASVNNSMTMTVNTPGSPSVVVISDPGNEVCQGTAVTVSAVPSYGGTAPSYSWVKNGVVVGSADTFNFIPANGDSIYCKISSNYKCRLANTAISNVVNLTVDVPAVLGVTLTADNGGNIAAGVRETITATVTNGGTSPHYQWLVNGALVPGATLPVFSGNNFQNLDVVTCKVTGSSVCSGSTGSSSVTIHLWRDGVQQVVAPGSDIRILPNPNKGVFTIKGSLGSADNEEVTVEMTDMLGQVVLSGKVLAVNGMLDTQLQPGNSLANGMYLLSLRTATESKVFHVVIEK